MDNLKSVVIKHWKGILAICVWGVFCFICIWKTNRLYKLVTEVKTAVSREIEYKSMHKEKVQIDAEMPLVDEEDAWYTQYHFIAHAGGGYNGRTYTNSLDAWENSYKMGNRVFDADLAFTSDGELVLRHEWNANLEQGNCSMRESFQYIDKNGHIQFNELDYGVPTYTEFMSKKIFYNYTPMSCGDMIRFMAEHKDLYVACDMKDDIRQSYQYIVDKATLLSYEEILDRIIVNIYDYDAYDIVMGIYPFTNATMRQHYVHPNNYYEMIDFCLTHDIHVVNLSCCYIEDEGVQMLRSKGIHVYVAIADYISDMRDYHDLGADGAVTNWLYENEWQYVVE